jgi:hypothetical protein
VVEVEAGTLLGHEQGLVQTCIEQRGVVLGQGLQEGEPAHVVQKPGKVGLLDAGIMEPRGQLSGQQGGEQGMAPEGGQIGLVAGPETGEQVQDRLVEGDAAHGPGAQHGQALAEAVRGAAAVVIRRVGDAQDAGGDGGIAAHDIGDLGQAAVLGFTLLHDLQQDVGQGGELGRGQPVADVLLDL